MPADDSQSPRRNDEPVISGDDVILSEATAAPGREEPVPATPLTPHDLATPYVLDALAPEERDAYEEHLAGCAICQQRVSELEMVAGLLPDAMVTPPADLPDAYPYLLRDVAHETLPFSATMPASFSDQAEQEPDVESAGVPNPFADQNDPVDLPDLPAAERDPSAMSHDEFPPLDDIVDQREYDASEDDGDGAIGTEDLAEIGIGPESELRGSETPDDDEHADEQSAAVPAVGRRTRPPGRIRPGVRPTGVQAPAEPLLPRSAGRSSPILIALAVLGVIAIGLFLWALLLQGRVNDLEDEIDQQNSEIAALRQQANATAYTLSPTVDGPPGASGTFFFSLPDQRGALVARGLTAAPEGQAYQLWYIEDENATPIAGPTFQVNAGGEAVVPLTAEVSTFDAVAISLEPADGSDVPSTPLLLQGRLGGAAG